MSQYPFKNLATVRYKINKFLTDKRVKTNLECRFLNKLLCKLGFIETDISCWYSGSGLIYQYQQETKMFPYRETLPPTTKDFIKERHETRKLQEAFIKNEIGLLLEKVNEKLDEKPIQNQFSNLLQKIADDLATLPENIDKYQNWTPEQNTDSYMFDYARLLGATLKPYAQCIDPLGGQSAGYCAGLSHEWADLVNEEKVGISSANVSITQAVSELQKLHLRTFFTNSRTLINQESLEQLGLIISILDDVRDINSYYLHFSNHLIGIRYLPNSSLVEIFEPNFGHMTFPNRFLAAEWIHELLHTESYVKRLEYIALACGPDQPADTHPSVPFNILSANTLPFTQTYIHQNLNEQNLFLPWMQKALLKAYQNHIEGEKHAKELCEEKLKNQLASLSQMVGALYQVDISKGLKHTSDDYLKEKVCERLQVQISKRDDPECFAGLIEKIKSAPPYITLSTVIQDWLGDENSETNERNAYELCSFDYRILADFIKQNEISHYHLAFNRIDVLYHFLHALDTMIEGFQRIHTEVSPFFKKLKGIILGAFAEGMSIDACWIKLIECSKAAAANNPSKCFTELTDDEFDYQFANDIAKVDIDNPKSLSQFLQRLRLVEKEFENHLTNKKRKIQTLIQPTTLLPDLSFASFSELYHEAESKNLKGEISIRSLHELYRLLPSKLIMEKVKPFTDSYLDLLKKIASKDLCLMNKQMKLFKPFVCPIYHAIQSATSIIILAIDLVKNGTTTEYSKTSPMYALCELILALATYKEKEKNPRAYCLIDSFAARYGLTLDTCLDDTRDLSRKPT